MIKFLIDLVQIAVMLNLVCIVVKWVFFRGKKGKKTAMQKLVLLASRKMHHKLDIMLKRQKESLAPSVVSTQKQDIPKPKVVPLRVVKHG